MTVLLLPYLEKTLPVPVCPLAIRVATPYMCEIHPSLIPKTIHSHPFRNQLEVSISPSRSGPGAGEGPLWGTIPQVQFLEYHSFCFVLILLFIFWETEGEREQVGEGQREDPKWALCCQQQARYRAQNHKSWDHVLSWSWMLNRLSHPGTPLSITLFCLSWYASFKNVVSFCFNL